LLVASELCGNGRISGSWLKQATDRQTSRQNTDRCCQYYSLFAQCAQKV